jgi:hypothetical protein
MRVLSNGLAFAFDKVEAKPKTVSLQIIDAKVGGSPTCQLTYPMSQ